ncbi:MAG: protein kinase [Anaerolineae bacterium]|jgi:serine/threonine protein kinase|nr:protein kinase [Anaerolineae bacterium]
MATQKDDLIGKVLGQFEIIEEIGRGGMATVYRARQLSMMNRVVAVKVLPRHLLHDPSFYERFEREVEVISHLEHPHIVPIYEYGQDEGVPYIAMRYLGGGSLEQQIRRRLPGLNEIERPLRQIAQALDYAHQQGIIHRDLKPGNIMLDESGNAYLSDFGIARVLGSNLTGSMIVGTPAYMSPEQANGLPIDGRSDIYALGVVLFEMLTGREPYQAETPMAILLKHINEPMPPISTYRSDVPMSVEYVLAISTSKDPDDRYTSASSMVEAFATALREPDAPPPANLKLPTKTAPMSAPIPKATTPITAPMPSETAVLAPSSGRNWTAIAVVSILLLLFIGGITLIVTQLNVDTGSDVIARPTAFPNSSVVEQPNYSITIPNAWIPPTVFNDYSDSDRMIHAWEATDGTAFVTFALVGADNLSTEAGFRAAINAYDQRYVQPQSEYLTLIDEATAPNGTLRRSYRVNAAAPFNPPGQMDVFYQAQGDQLSILELYTADSTANTLVPTLQLILDSLRVPTDV